MELGNWLIRDQKHPWKKAIAFQEDSQNIDFPGNFIFIQHDEREVVVGDDQEREVIVKLIERIIKERVDNRWFDYNEWILVNQIIIILSRMYNEALRSREGRFQYSGA